jgi:hypothetical protein
MCKCVGFTDERNVLAVDPSVQLDYVLLDASSTADHG